MDRKKLYSIFHMHGHIHNGEWAIAPSKEGALLDDIAQAYDQEMAEARLADGRIQSEGSTKSLKALQKYHEQEVAELKTEMGKARDLLGAAYGLLRRAQEEEGDGQEDTHRPNLD